MENNEITENYINEKTGIEYKKVGDYFVPNIILEQKEKVILNKYGRVRLRFLKENKRAEYTVMFMDGTLNNYIKEIQKIVEKKTKSYNKRNYKKRKYNRRIERK